MGPFNFVESYMQSILEVSPFSLFLLPISPCISLKLKKLVGQDVKSDSTSNEIGRVVIGGSRKRQSPENRFRRPPPNSPGTSHG
jgi:hypothetical protein